MHAADRLVESIERTGSIACVGLDPRPDQLPPSLIADVVARHGDGPAAVARAFRIFNEAVIDAIAGRCAAVKPQAACYEAYGLPGWEALAATIAHATAAGVPVILDAKRGDMGSTATHYGQMVFGGAPLLAGPDAPGPDAPGPGAPGAAGIGAGWVTLNAYLGADCVEAVLDAGDAAAPATGNGVFVLVKTSNPSSGDLQDVPLADGETTVAEHMADLVRRWGKGRIGTSGLSDVGAVVGATYPDHARALRERMPDTVFLVPGYGHQGGTAADALAGARPDGSGVLVSSSRGITAAWRNSAADRGEDWAAAAGDALDAMNADLATAR